MKINTFSKTICLENKITTSNLKVIKYFSITILFNQLNESTILITSPIDVLILIINLWIFRVPLVKVDI